MKLSRRCEFHTHTLFSDGELLPVELIRMACISGHEVIAITDHVDFSNLEFVLKNQKRIADSRVSGDWDIKVIRGVELTHIPKNKISKLAKKAKELGAEIVLAHGETLVEPVEPGTNSASVKCEYVDILAHPGLITAEEADAAKENNIYLEISARRGHSLGNGLVAKTAKETGAGLLVNTDAHSPGDLINSEMAFNIAVGAGLSKDDAYGVVTKNPEEFMKRLG
ncbi:MAG: PHP domain-containing protein [Candidatus Altiarchaeales archaeon WOR_SM1_86-2]|nr:MAG: PHP domain-containing protein [Candidatus Altiarchaeales archaeon WOR_SM1_86-2]ODS36109.1 MAG: PHP domain-containing protein [Candidatus Altiarchaeales archaeon WOR_SM1_79]